MEMQPDRSMEPERFREIRKTLKLTQIEMAEALGMSQSAVNKMEKGALPIERRTALAMLYLHQQGERVTKIETGG